MDKATLKQKIRGVKREIASAKDCHKRDLIRHLRRLQKELYLLEREREKTSIAD